MSTQALEQTIESLWETRDGISSATKGAPREAVDAALDSLEAGTARVAEPTAAGWQVNQWLK